MRSRLVVLLAALIAISTQAQAASSIWEPWLPKLAVRVQVTIERAGPRYSFLHDRLVPIYAVPNMCFEECPGRPVIERNLLDGNMLSFRLLFNDVRGRGQYLTFSSQYLTSVGGSAAPPILSLDLAKRSGEPYNHRCSLSLFRATFAEAIAALQKLGVKAELAKDELPDSGERSVRLKNRPVLEIVGRTLALYGMEGWQSGDKIVVYQKIIRGNTPEDEALASLTSAIDRELRHHDIKAIEEFKMNEEMIGWLLQAVAKLPPRDTPSASWQYEDLSPQDQREWQNLSRLLKVMRYASQIAQIQRILESR